MVGRLQHKKSDPDKSRRRGSGLYYYRGKVKALGNKPYWSKYSEIRDAEKRKVKMTKKKFTANQAHKLDSKKTKQGKI